MSDEEIKRLQGRIIAFAMVGILLTGLVVGVSTAVPQYSQAKVRAEEALRFNVRVQGLAVGQLLAKWRDIALQITSRTRIREGLEAYNRGEMSLAELRRFSEGKLLDALAQSQAAIGIIRHDARRAPVVEAGIVPQLDHLPGAHLDGETPVAYIPATSGGEEFLLVEAPILSRAGEREGTDIVVFQIAPLMRLVQPVESESHQAFIAHRGSVVVGGASSPSVRALLDRAADEGGTVLEALANGKVAVATPVDVPRWQIAVVVPEQQLYASAAGAMVFPVVSIVVMVFGGMLGTGRLMRPLARRAVGHASELAATAAEQSLVLENARDFVYRQDTEGRFSFVSPAVTRVTGYSPREWIGRNLSLAPLSGKVPDDGVHGTYQIEFAHRDGHPITLEINEQVYRKEGRTAGVVGIARDVSERVRAERALERSSMEWSRAMDFFDDAIFIVDLDDRLIRANRAFYELSGLSPAEVDGRQICEAIHPEGSCFHCPACRARREARDARVTMEPDENPARRPLEVTVTTIRDGRNQPIAVLSAIRDLTLSRETEQELTLAASVFEGSQEAVVIVDLEWHILRVNRAFSSLTALDAEAITGRPVSELLGSLEGLPERIWTIVDKVGQHQGEASYRRRNGESFPVWYRISAQHDVRGQLMHYIVSLTDITDKKHSEQRIEHLAYYDMLTELPNRSLFIERLQHALDRVRRQRHQLAVLFLDLDRFKNINDTLGHLTGDEVLIAVAQRLRECVRHDDTVSRLGGDEFAVILEDIEGLAEVEGIARKVLEAMGNPVRLEAHELFVGGSIGISLFPEDGGDAETLLQHADSAMYRAKERGRNTYEFYTPELTRITSARLQMENDLRRALERDELLVYLQPQALVEDGRIVGAEALVRWEKPDGKLVSPGAFIPLAEETGLIEPIGRKVLFDACRQIAEWRDEGLADLRVAVNVAGYQILEGDIVGSVRDVLDATGIEPRQLELEITEGFVMSRPGDGIDALTRLRELGITLAIDDFGTGYSSLAYLKRLPIDRLKIDRSFIRDLPDDRDDAAIASTIIAMAGHLGLEVLAEGVEEEAQLEFLRRYGCEEFQGFYLSRPVPAKAFRKLLLQRHSRQLANPRTTGCSA